MSRLPLLSLFCLLLLAAPGSAAEPRPPASSAERGRKALLETNFIPPSMTLVAYENVWKQWGLKQKPARDEFDRLFRERYGLHPAPYPNNGYPMGLREGSLLFGLGKGVVQDCLICHGGSIAGQSYI